MDPSRFRCYLEDGSEFFFYLMSMTPFRLRLSVVAFLALTGAITANALYMQESPRQVARAGESLDTGGSHNDSATAALPDADTKPSAPVSETPKTVASPNSETVRKPATKKATETAPPPPSSLVNNIQRELGKRGYFSGKQDGVLTRDCRVAILAYEFDENMPLSGEASEAVLKALIFARAAGNTAGPGAAKRFERRKELIKQVQQMLAQYGYTSGPVNGELDARTRDAIKQFESDRHLEAAGHLSERVLLEMVIVAGQPFPASS
jgi:peptidoglycan hydrolase-like protein with peptidoglycan-binding domain